MKMMVLVFCGIVILFSLMLIVTEKVRAFNSKEGFSFSFDGDSVKVKSKKSNVVKGERTQALNVSQRMERKIAC